MVIMAQAQSPQPLSGNELRGPLSQEQQLQQLYSFEAGPGEVTVTLEVKTSGTGSQLEASVLGQDSATLLRLLVTSNQGKRSELLRLSARQSLILKLQAPNSNHNGSYALTLKGPVFPGAANRPGHSPPQPNGSSRPSPSREPGPPKIEILLPEIKRGQNVRLKVCSLTLKGRVTDESEIRDVAVNGAPVSLDRQNEFSTSLALQAGNNPIFVTATNAHGKTAREEFSLVCDGASPPVAAGNTPPPPSPGKLTGMKQYALVIGINEYKEQPKLRTAANDAKEIAQVLEKEFGFQVEVLLNAEATRSKIIDTLQNYQTSVQEGDRLLVYYAGHGFNDTSVEKAYWLPVDATLNRSSWISADDITTNLTGIKKAQQILVVSDSCYSGELARSPGTRRTAPTFTPAERDKFLERTAKERSRVLIASGGNEPVADGGGGGHSIFAAKFLLGLREMDPNPFTANELFNAFISVSVSGNSDQLPRLGALLSAGHKGGDFIFVRRQ